MVAQIFNIVFPLFAIVMLGYFYGRRHAPDMAAANKLNIEIFVPALIFNVLSSKEFNLGEYQCLALGGIGVIFGSGLLAWPIASLLNFRFKTFVPPMMFNNSGNMGLPLALFAFGEAALPAAIVLFLIENTLHFSVGIKILDSRSSITELLKTPLLIATFTGLTVTILHIEIPEALAIPIEMIGQVCIPLMLFSLGVRLIHVDWRAWRIGMAGAIVCPLSGILIALGMGTLLSLNDSQYPMLVVFGALPPAVLNYMLAERFNQEPEQVAAIVMMGNLASIAVIPAILVFVL